jgi:hypothetical protein
MKKTLRVLGLVLGIGLVIGATAIAWGPSIVTWSETKTSYSFMESDLRMALGIPARTPDEPVSLEVTTQRIPWSGMKYFFVVTHSTAK